MSYGRQEHVDDDVRDIAGDYLKAYIAEYESYKAAGNPRASQVADVLKQLGHNVDPPKMKERAVPQVKTEKVVEADVPGDTAKTEAKKAAEKAVE